MRTVRELYKELRDKHGITTSTMFHENLDEEITEETFNWRLKIMSSLFDDIDEEDEDE
ncbi:hypothetical protein IGI37_002095 [Enterococcus sp. AZ194]|uniref:hypothetical protein n=1 Tax=Enterococcus sp. AZ194 TaxID=2774629 RepID=UPI003F214FC9